MTHLLAAARHPPAVSPVEPLPTPSVGFGVTEKTKSSPPLGVAGGEAPIFA